MPASTTPAPQLPQHVAIIMDGNGRWARMRNKPRHMGHKAGADTVREIVRSAARRGIRYLTLFAFSSENWNRPRDEVSRLMTLFVDALRREVDDLHTNNVRLEFIGAREHLKAHLVDKICAAEKTTAKNTGLNLLVAVAYGGRWDIVNACRRISARVSAGEIEVAGIDESMLNDALQLAHVPDPDLLIRTGGEQRISNFLLWNLAYAELYFCDTLWPDFGNEQFDTALEFFAQRHRRYGCVDGQIGIAKG